MKREIINKLKAKDVNKILNWVKDSGIELYKHMYQIEHFQAKGQMMGLVLNGIIIGCLTWNEDEENIIDILGFCIHPNYRCFGHGSYFLNEFEKLMRTRRHLGIEVDIFTAESELMANKHGYKKFHSDFDKLGYENRYFKQFPTNVSDKGFKLELWDKEPHQAGKYNPVCVWKDFSKIIMYPANPKWKLRLSFNEKVIEEGTVKDFKFFNQHLISGAYLFIN